MSFGHAKSYSAFSGVQDAMTQWWYGHNAVAFFLTAGFLGMMYYYLPKRAGRPIFSYRLSIISFWGITFMYMWAGSHHLHYTALPQWVQTLGMTFSLVLLVPSWASAGNALATLNGAWHKVRDDATLRFMMAAAVFYGLSTFEGSFLAIRPVNSLSHYTDWTVGHVHAGALGWVALITFGSIYSVVPWLWKRERMYSARLVEVHFWLAIIRNGHLRLRDVEFRHHPGADVADLQRERNADLLVRRVRGRDASLLHRAHLRRAAVPDGRGGRLVQCLDDDPRRDGSRREIDRGRARAQARARSRRSRDMADFHRKIERNAIGFVLAIVVVASIGGFVEIAPLFTIDETVESAPDMRVYTPLELAGRNIYIREGCYACHSQMIRTLRDEVERYGPYSLAVESKYDHPMLWGSKRTGPDLARVGGKYSDAWHVAHLINPRDVVPESVMPKYGWLQRNALRIDDLGEHLTAMRRVGVPYTDDNDRQRHQRRARPGDTGQQLCERRHRALRRGDAGQVVRRRSFDDHRDGCARRLSPDSRPSHRRRAKAGVSGDGDGTMNLDHDTVVGFAKSWGLFYLIAMAVGVLIYAFWPSNLKRFHDGQEEHSRRGRQAMEVGERDPVTGQLTTGHEWNGIKELYTPVPRVVIFFLVVDDPVRGRILDPHACLAVGQDLHEGAARDRPEDDCRAPGRRSKRGTRRMDAGRSTDGLRGDQGRPGPDGRSCAKPESTLFGDNCAACHGMRGTGGKGFPDLTAGAWLWGGDPETIAETLRVGINSYA